MRRALLLVLVVGCNRQAPVAAPTTPQKVPEAPLVKLLDANAPKVYPGGLLAFTQEFETDATAPLRHKGKRYGFDLEGKGYASSENGKWFVLVSWPDTRKDKANGKRPYEVYFNFGPHDEKELIGFKAGGLISGVFDKDGGDNCLYFKDCRIPK